jgi:uncharacterized protein with von Willebrand factor type A (vWA) domain
VLRPGDVAGQVEAILHFFSGGTDTVLALNEARRQVDALRDLGHKGADIVFITDGTDSRKSEIHSSVERIIADGTRLWTVGIDLVMPETNALRSLATKHIALDRKAMNDPASLVALVASL